MVKRLDEIETSLADHVGWRLWQASRAWQAEFVAAMRDAGHGWLTDARATLMGMIPRSGIRQSDLLARLGTTKQAVQQLLDGLEAEGVVERVADPRDRRGRLVRYTQKGHAALRDGDRIKPQIERDWIARIGDARFGALMDALRELDRAGRPGAT
jgi:DNA-binding MarR family transcriptional regulator